MKTAVYTFMLMSIAVIWFACGFTYAEGSTEPITEIKTVETVVEVPVVKEWDSTMYLGVGQDLSLTELEEDYNESDYVYILTVQYNKGDSMAESVIWVPFGEGNYAGVSLTIPCSEFQVTIHKAGAPDPSKMPKPLAPNEEEF